MKLHYFEQPKADADDTQLQEAIQAGHVPATCLLGGALVTRLAADGDDPCAFCPGPRPRCNGRPRQHEVDILDGTHPLARDISVGEIGARKLQRRQWMDVLDGWVDDELQRREKRDGTLPRETDPD